MDASKLFVGLLIIAVAITQLQGIKMKYLCNIMDALMTTELKHSEIKIMTNTYQKRCGCSINNNTNHLNPILTINGKTTIEIINQVYHLTDTYLNLTQVDQARANEKGLDPILHWLRQVKYTVGSVRRKIGANSTRTKTQKPFTSIWLVAKLRGLKKGSTKYNDTKIYYTLRELEAANVNIKRKLEDIKRIENKTVNCTGTNRDAGVFGKQSNASTLSFSSFGSGQSNGTSRYFFKGNKNPANSKPIGQFR